jgi:hypothetical protein
MARSVLVGLGLVLGLEDARVLSESFKISVEVPTKPGEPPLVQWVVPAAPRTWPAKRPALNGATATSTAFKLVAGPADLPADQAALFAFEGPKNDCIIWKVSDAQKLALNSFAWSTFNLNTPMSLWNEDPAPAVEAHSRFTIEEDGRIAPNVTDTFVEHLGGRFVLGLNAGGVALVNRGPFPEGVPAPLFFKATF